MSIDLLVDGGWTAEDFDGSPSAVYDNGTVECRVVMDEDGDAFLLLGHIESEMIQLYTISGDLASAFEVLRTTAPALDVETVAAMVGAISRTDVEITGADGIVIEPENLAAMDRLGVFRAAFWQVFPYGDPEHAGAYAANDDVACTVLEYDAEPGWIVQFADLEDDELEETLAWLVPGGDETAGALIAALPMLEFDGVADLARELGAIKQMEIVDDEE